MEKEQQPVTFGKVMRVAFGGWKLLLAVALGVTVAGTLAISLGYNKSRGAYVSTFSYNKADLNNNMYADGSDFYYSEIVFKENLQKVVDSDEQLKSIDLDKIFDSNRLSFEKVLVDELPVYTLSIPTKFFSSQGQAKVFFEKAANYPVERDEQLLDKSNYERNLTSFDTASTYEAQVNHLIGHANTLLTSYEKMEDSEKETVSVSALAIIGNNKAEINNIAGEKNVNLTNLLLTVNDKGYVKDYDCEEAQHFEETIESLQAEKANNTARIDALKTTLNGLDPSITLTNIDELIAELVERNVQIDSEIDAINKKIANKGNTNPDFLAGKKAFEEMLLSYRNKLSQCTVSYVNVLRQSYTSTSSVAFTNTGVIEEKGTISIPMAIALSLVAGVVVGGIVNLIVRRKMFSE